MRDTPGRDLFNDDGFLGIVIALVPNVYVTFKYTVKPSDAYCAVYELNAQEVDWFSYNTDDVGHDV